MNLLVQRYNFMTICSTDTHIDETNSQKQERDNKTKNTENTKNSKDQQIDSVNLKDQQIVDNIILQSPNAVSKEDKALKKRVFKLFKHIGEFKVFLLLLIGYILLCLLRVPGLSILHLLFTGFAMYLFWSILTHRNFWIIAIFSLISLFVNIFISYYCSTTNKKDLIDAVKFVFQYPLLCNLLSSLYLLLLLLHVDLFSCSKYLWSALFALSVILSLRIFVARKYDK